MISAKRKQLYFSHNPPKEREPTDLCTETKLPGLTVEPIGRLPEKMRKNGKGKGVSLMGLRGRLKGKMVLD